MSAWKFSSCAHSEKPDNETTRLLEKAQAGGRLSREEKDRVANILYGLFGAQSSSYKLAGWQWDMYPLIHQQKTSLVLPVKGSYNGR